MLGLFQRKSRPSLHSILAGVIRDFDKRPTIGIDTVSQANGEVLAVGIDIRVEPNEILNRQTLRFVYHTEANFARDY